MLKIDKEQQGLDKLVVRFSGTMDETVNLELHLGPISEKLNRLELHLKELQRMNSEGVRRWMLFFENLKKLGVTVEYLECSPAIVEQANLIRNFTCGGKIISLYLPFCCNACHKSFLMLSQAAALEKVARLPEQTCPNCQTGKIIFDDNPDEYFEFLRREGKNAPAG